MSVWLLSFLLSASALADDHAPVYSGIWQDTNPNGGYYVIQESGSSLVLIALPGVEASGDTLRFSYIGDRDDLLVSRLSDAAAPPDILQRLQLSFTSSNQGIIIPICEVCGVVAINIVKVF